MLEKLEKTKWKTKRKVERKICKLIRTSMTPGDETEPNRGDYHIIIIAIFFKIITTARCFVTTSSVQGDATKNQILVD
jgi:hypothetical protein